MEELYLKEINKTEDEIDSYIKELNNFEIGFSRVTREDFLLSNLFEIRIKETDEIVGKVCTSLDEFNTQNLCIWGFYIKNDKQSRGYGKSALKAIVECFKNDYSLLFACCEKENVRALNMYMKYAMFAFDESTVLKVDDVSMLFKTLKEYEIVLYYDFINNPYNIKLLEI